MPEDSEEEFGQEASFVGISMSTTGLKSVPTAEEAFDVEDEIRVYAQTEGFFMRIAKFSDQTARLRRRSESSLGAHVILLVLSAQPVTAQLFIIRIIL